MASPAQQMFVILRLLKVSLSFHLSQANNHIAHLNRYDNPPSPLTFPIQIVSKGCLLVVKPTITSCRLLASTSHLDSLLSALYYTITFLASFPSLPWSVPISLRPLAGLISTLRITLRLSGLLGIYSWALSVCNLPSQSDRVLRFIAWTQIAVNVNFQGLENGAFLADHGVLRDWSVNRRQWWWRWSSRAWMCHVGLEGARLGREWMLESRRRKEILQRTPEALWNNAVEESGEKSSRRIEQEDDEAAALVREVGEKESKIQRHLLRRRWWRQVVVNGAFFPLTLHCSMDEGLLGDRWVGLLGMVASEATLRQAWRETA